MKIGANYLGNGICEFVVWSPLPKDVAVRLVSPVERAISMEPGTRGYRRAIAEDVFPGTLYFYKLDGKRDRPDPASCFQPRGVHGPSQVFDHGSVRWEDNGWRGIPLAEMIIYELHIGTFTPEGTLVAIIPRLDDLKNLGINTLEIMPVAQFPGERNWGYDGVYPFAVQNSYGGPEGLKCLVNECHKKGLAVILDVVYNHLGPEGNYLRDYGPYFTDKYKTPWGQAINFDDAHRDEVRNYFIENALHWFKHYHIDALRLDAIHGIADMSAKPFLMELAERVEDFSSREGRKFCLMAESDLNDSRVIRPRELGGYGLDALWCDDFHHALHTILTGEKDGYYIDFGRIGHLVKSMREGFIYTGEYSEYRKKSHGISARDRPGKQFMVFSQNHDQVGNRWLGERLSNLVSFESLKLAAGVVLLSPFVPLLFMGEEYGEAAPFLYFVSHSDPALIEAVRQGRREEFKLFNHKGEPPDPQAMETLLKSRLNWHKRSEGNHKVLLAFYARLIKLRRGLPGRSTLDKKGIDVYGFEDKGVILVKRRDTRRNRCAFYAFNFYKADVDIAIPFSKERWRKVLDSADSCWKGPGSALPDVISGTDMVTLKEESLVPCNSYKFG